MISKLTITKQYAKYIKNIKSCDNAQVITNFNKLSSFLKNLFSTQAEDEELLTHIKLDSIFITIKEIRRRNIRLKENASSWNSSEIERFFTLLKNACEKRKACITQQCSEQDYLAVEGVLTKCIQDQEDPSIQLYMYLKHDESIDGKGVYIDRGLYKSSRKIVENLLKAESEEEIDKILQGEED